MRFRSCALVASLLVAAPAYGHQGSLPSTAVFTAPPAPTVSRTDGGLSVAPYTFAQADASFDVRWTVALANDPTGRFAFYYLDYTPPPSVSYDQIRTIATAIPEASGDNAIWVSCTCDNDAGVICPDAGSRAGKCDLTQFTWNTASVPSGAYWLIALNDDPPYRIYTVSRGPVRVAHGAAALPPASTVVLPDGLFAADRSYRTLWLSTGQAPLHFNVFYGINDVTHALDAPKPLGTDITPISNPDGSYSYDWDLSSYVDGYYYFGVEVSDATAQKSSARSFFGLNVYHPPKDGGPDLGNSDGAPEASIETGPPDASVSMPDASTDGPGPGVGSDARQGGQGGSAETPLDSGDTGQSGGAGSPAKGSAGASSLVDSGAAIAPAPSAADEGGCSCTLFGSRAPRSTLGYALTGLLAAVARRHRRKR